MGNTYNPNRINWFRYFINSLGFKMKLTIIQFIEILLKSFWLLWVIGLIGLGIIIRDIWKELH